MSRLDVAFLIFLTIPSKRTGAAEDQPRPPHRVFASSTYSIDEILTRPYDADVPFGSVGDRLWASSPQGWAFADDVHWIYLTNLKAFDLEIRDEHGRLEPARATYYPSHVHMEGAERVAEASASFTYQADKVIHPLKRPFHPDRRWTCWSSGRRDDWYAVDFGAPRTLTGLKLWFYDDSGRGACRPPESYEVEIWRADEREWSSIPFRPASPTPKPDENTIAFDEVTTDRIKVTFRHAGSDFYTGLYGLESIDASDGVPLGAATDLAISADKWITQDDVLVSVLRIHNPTSEPRTFSLAPLLHGPYNYAERKAASPDQSLVRRIYLRAEGQQTLHDQEVAFGFRSRASTDEIKLRGNEHGGMTMGTTFGTLWTSGGSGVEPDQIAEKLNHRLGPGESAVFKTAMAWSASGPPGRNLEAIVPDDASLTPAAAAAFAAGRRPGPPLDDRVDPLPDQIADYQAWFDQNIPYFDCSDEWVKKLYYHRAYVLRKNMMEPKLGRLKYPTQSEGRWRSTWYPNVISYGAAHQVREARWLRDPRYWLGHLKTWAEHQKVNHVYPGRVMLDGPLEWQYTDWISSTAWDGHLVHPAKEELAGLIDKLADNVRGIQKTYDTDEDGLLEVDSHWWTGMEYQPSFFSFGDYKTRPDFNEPVEQPALERVDFTAYQFGNARNVAAVYRMLGRDERAAEFDALAARIANAVKAKMYKGAAGEDFFYSLRASDDGVAPVKEVVGVYPFYFNMFESSPGFEKAWTSILDPKQFWTPWPVASCSMQCPAYSQDGWPQSDGRKSTCMWNGPTWPHANSIVLTAMARTLRNDRDNPGPDSALTREKMWELFHSFTRAQFRHQDPSNPWTGEFYRGDDATWKTPERDYNHSTWLDVLIPDLLGVVPRPDDVLEIDPMLPDGVLTHFLLDGLSYHGRDVTLCWDAPGDGDDRYGDGREGFQVYVDGKEAAAADCPSRLFVDLNTGLPVVPSE